MNLYARGSSISWKVPSHLASTEPCYKHYYLEGKTKVGLCKTSGIRNFPIKAQG